MTASQYPFLSVNLKKELSRNHVASQFVGFNNTKTI